MNINKIIENIASKNYDLEFIDYTDYKTMQELNDIKTLD